MSSKKELNDLDYAFKKAQLDLMLIEIEERRFRLAEEKKKAQANDWKKYLVRPGTEIPRETPTWPTQPPIWQQPHVIPTPFTSEQKYTLDNIPRAMINCGVSE